MTVRSQAYLPHVDGLRCVAVLSVLLFHFGVPGLGGGFVGVDVFFVISGYLITKVIVDEVTATGKFDFRNFYSRRIRRILPALLATLAVTTVLAVASLTPSDLVAYGKSLVASAISMSNLLFWSESGYFDAVSKTKPLLHTWSLSVEEQFYLVWPALIFLSYRWFGRKWLFWSIVAAGVLSFAANHAAVSAGRVGFESDLFFLPHFRVFEFAIGALGCFVLHRLPSSRWLHESMMALGLALIAWSIATLREGMVFPYVHALAPCLGTLLVILARGARSVAAILTNRLAVWIGVISYSLYLTHWPVVVFVDQYMPTTAWAIKFVVMATLSLVTAVVLHHRIETRFRYAGAETDRRRRVGGILVSSAALCALGAVVFASNGMAWRYQYFTPGSLGESKPLADAVDATNPVDGARDVKVAARTPRSAEPAFHPLDAEQVEAGKGRRFADLAGACNVEALKDPARCFMDRPTQVLLYGNSHEPDAFNALHHVYGQDPRVNLINFGTVNDCQLVFRAGTVKSTTKELACDKRYAVLGGKAFAKKIDVVVYNTHKGFDPVARELWRVLEILKKKNPSIRIVAIGSYLQTSADCASLYNKYRTYDACRSAEFVNYFNPDEREKSTIPQVKSLDYLYISKYDLLCDQRMLATCRTFANGEPAFYDQHHLSMGFSQYMGDRLIRMYGAELAGIGLPLPAHAEQPASVAGAKSAGAEANVPAVAASCCSQR